MAGVGEAGGRQAEKLGYLGLGMMGFPMTRRLVNAGYDVTVWNRSSGKAAALVEAGAKLSAYPRDVAAAASIIFTCLTDAKAVEEVVFGPDGIATARGQGKVVVDFSSIHPDAARAIAARLDPAENAPPGLHESDPFAQGLYGASEMLVESFLDLMHAGILKREVDGVLLSAAFFLGSRTFYRSLRDMPEAQLAKLRMTSVLFVNELYGDEAAKRRARVKARFINNAMMATLLGAVVSDALENGQVVSGVGGQYNFVAQAFALEDARSIIMVRATREAHRRTTSNIRWNYGHTTIPRHLRDVVVTEYGIADLRGKTDRDVIADHAAKAQEGPGT